MKLNAKTISRPALPAGKTDHIIFDEDLPGFGIRLRGGGKITWIIQYRVGSKQRRVMLGTAKLGDRGTLNAKEARAAARDRTGDHGPPGRMGAGLPCPDLRRLHYSAPGILGPRPTPSSSAMQPTN
jgi:hypothetical protein